MIEINSQAPQFTAKAYHKNDFPTITLEDHKGRWVVLFFYPADFTFVCPTELEELSEHYDLLQKMGVDIISVSTDTEFVHKAWHDHSPAIGKVQFPMLADSNGTISRSYGVYIDDKGMAMRGTFIIDPDGILQAMEVHNDGIGRSAEELVRKVQAAQFVREHGEVCPAGWKPGGKTLKPGIDLVGNI